MRGSAWKAMRHIVAIGALAACFMVSGCATVDVARISDVQYPPSQTVELLFGPPARPHSPFAILEARGAVGISPTSLLEKIRNEAKAIGADAVIFTGATSEQRGSGFLFNPALGGYQSIPGGSMPIVRATAIRYLPAAITPNPADNAAAPADARPSTPTDISPVGAWQGTIRSAVTGQAIPATLSVTPSGEAIYTAANGVRIVGTVNLGSADIRGTGTMFMPVGPTGKPAALFPNGRADSPVTLSGKLAGNALSGSYIGGGDRGVFDFVRSASTVP